MKLETFVRIHKDVESSGDIYYYVLGENKDLSNKSRNYFGSNNLCMSCKIVNNNEDWKHALEMATYDAIRLLKFVGKTSSNLKLSELSVDEESVVTKTIKFWSFE